MHIQKLNKDQRFDADVEVQFEDEYKKQKTNDICIFNNEFVVLTRIKKEGDQTKFYLSTLNKNTLESNLDFKEVLSFDRKSYYGCSVKLIPFENHLIATFFLSEVGGIVDHGYALIDTEFEVLSKVSYQKFYKEDLGVRPLNHYCSSTGDVSVYFLNSLLNGSYNPSRGGAAFLKTDYFVGTVVKLTSLGELIYETSFEFPNYEMQINDFKVLENENVVISGLCYDIESNKSETKGWVNTSNRVTKEFKEIGKHDINYFYVEIEPKKER